MSGEDLILAFPLLPVKRERERHGIVVWLLYDNSEEDDQFVQVPVNFLLKVTVGNPVVLVRMALCGAASVGMTILVEKIREANRAEGENLFPPI